MILNRSDIVQIPFPFSNLKSSKRRPVLLLTELDTLGDFLAVAITSQPGHHDAISLKNDDLINGILPKQSWIRGTKLFSLNQEVVVANLGSLKIVSFERVHREICMKIGCHQL
jgi:mRNA interferase MazF